MKNIFFIIIFLVNASLVGQDKVERIIVVGDSLVGRSEDGISYRDVIGNVVMTQGNIKITCEKIIQNLTANNAELIGNVVVTQDSITIVSERGYYYGNQHYIYSDKNVTLDDGHITLTADTGYYYFNIKKSVFNSNVELVDSGSILKSQNLVYWNEIEKAIAVKEVSIASDEAVIFCDSLIYFRLHQKSYAYNNVRVINHQQGLTITGDELYDEGESNYTRVTGNPLLTKIDSSGNGRVDTLFIKAKIFEAVEDSSNRLYAIDSVKIIRGDLFSVNNYSVLFREENRLMTRKRKGDKTPPVLWFATSQLVGDSINIYIYDNSLDSIQIRNNATILSQNENYKFRYDQISGSKIDLYFRKRELNKTVVNGEVLSIYFMYDEEKPNGLMKSSSNKAIMEFDSNAVEMVSMYESVQSEYHPENLVNGNELDFTLPSFILYKNKPKKEELIQGRE